MTYNELLEQARQEVGPYCKACPVCNGKACKNQMPGPGAKGVGDTAIRNYEKWQEFGLQMDTIGKSKADMNFQCFWKNSSVIRYLQVRQVLSIYTTGKNIMTNGHNNILVSACAEAGIAAMTGTA